MKEKIINKRMLNYFTELDEDISTYKPHIRIGGKHVKIVFRDRLDTLSLDTYKLFLKFKKLKEKSDGSKHHH